MQGSADQLKDQIWDNLETFFVKFAPKGGEMQTSQVETFIRDALGEQSQQQIDYVMKNLFRLDSDNSGSVSFIQLGNFLFKRHCGEMSLQKMHLANKMKKGAERKMDVQELQVLLNNAYAFLSVKTPSDLVRFIFQETDKDKDGLITYVEYFQIIDKYVVKKKGGQGQSKPVSAPVPAPTQQELQSRLRIHIWNELRRLYNAYVSGRHLSPSDQEYRRLLDSIVTDLTEEDRKFILTGLFGMDSKSITFEPFAEHFLFLIANLKLSSFAKNHSSQKKSLNSEEFILIFKNGFKWAKDVYRICDPFMLKIFNRIDGNRDNLITFDQYMDWVEKFLGCHKLFDKKYYVLPEDDPNSRFNMFEEFVQPVKKPAPKPQPRAENIQKPKPKPVTSFQGFKFSNFDFSDQVRKQTMEFLRKYDSNRDDFFPENDVHRAFVALTKENEDELFYTIRNYFRYNKSVNPEAPLETLTDFCIELHFGEMAIQRLHRRKYYSRGGERIMDFKQFFETLSNALKAINMSISDNQAKTLFNQIDLDRKGFITYEIYFLFLKYYFGRIDGVRCQRIEGIIGNICKLDSESAVHTVKKQSFHAPVPVLSEEDQFWLSLKGLNAYEFFVQLLFRQLKGIFARYDFNKNELFELDEIEAILGDVFQLNSSEAGFIISQYFLYVNRKQSAVRYEEIFAILLFTYFTLIVMQRKYKSSDQKLWVNSRLNLQDFINLVTNSCYFVRYKPTRQNLSDIFRLLDTDRDGWISFKQYEDFMKTYIGKNLPKMIQAPSDPTPADTVDVNSDEDGLIGNMWGELKVYFDHYDQGHKGYLNEEEIKAFTVEVLKQTSQRELDYIFWNLFRIDPDGNRQIEFEQFAPFILKHSGQISLQRFHRQQIKGKSTLNNEETYIVISNGYSYLKSVSKYKDVIVNQIFGRISKGQSTVAYGGLLGWVHKNLAKNVR